MGIAGKPFSQYKPEEITTENLHAFINSELGNWSQNVTLLLQENIKRKKLKLTGGLIESFDEQLQGAAAEMRAKVFFVFSDHGRHHDMKNMLYTKQAPVEVMEEFVRKIGVSKFKFVPGYKQGKIPSERIAVKRIAWALSRGRLLKYKHKPQRWFAKAFYGQINVLIETLMTGYQESMVNQAKTAFK